MELNKIKLILDDSGEIIDDYTSLPIVNQYATNYLIEVAFKNEYNDNRKYKVVFNIGGVETPAKILSPVNRYFTLNDMSKSAHIWEYQLSQYETQYYQDVLEFTLIIESEGVNISTQKIQLSMTKQKYGKLTPADLSTDTSLDSALDAIASLDHMVRDEIADLKVDVENDLSEFRNQVNSDIADVYTELENMRDEFDEKVEVVEAWAIGPNDTDDIPTATNNAKYYSDTAKNESVKVFNLMDSFEIIYVPASGEIIIRYEKDGETIEKKVDLPLEQLVVDVKDETDDEGNVYLVFTYAGGATTRIQLYDVLNGFVRKTTNKNAVYANNSNGEEINIPLDDPTNSGSIVRRTSGGSVKVPSPLMDTDAINLKYANDKLVYKPEDAPAKYIPGYANKKFIALNYGMPSDANFIVQRNNFGDIILPEESTTVSDNIAISRKYFKDNVKPINDKLDDFEYRVSQLESATLDYYDDDSLGYDKIVPDNAANYAIISNIRGRSSASKNLFDEETFFSSYGITRGDNGYFTKPYGTDIKKIIYENVEKLPGQFHLSFNVKIIEAAVTGTTGTFQVIYTDGTSEYICKIPGSTTSYTDITGFSNASKTVDHITWLYANTNYSAEFKNIILSYGEDRASYEPYYKGVRNTTVDMISSHGQNLIPFPYSGGDVKTENGLSYYMLYDGSIRVSGTPTNYTSYTIARNIPMSSLPEKVVIGYTTTTSNIYMPILIKNGSGNSVKEITLHPKNNVLYLNTREYPDNFSISVTIKRNDNNIYTSGIIYPIFVPGEVLPEKVKSYRGDIDSLSIPSIAGFNGLGVNNIYDEIDFDRNVYISRCGEMIITGNESWSATTKYPTSGCVRYTLELPDVAEFNNFVCNDYPAVNDVSINNPTSGININGNVLSFITTKGFTEGILTINKQEFIDYLKSRYNSGNPVCIVYAKQNYTETPIDEYDTKIRVESGGFVRFDNIYENPTNSTISYVIAKGGN